MLSFYLNCLISSSWPGEVDTFHSFLKCRILEVRKWWELDSHQTYQPFSLEPHNVKRLLKFWRSCVKLSYTLGSSARYTLWALQACVNAQGSCHDRWMQSRGHTVASMGQIQSTITFVFGLYSVLKKLLLESQCVKKKIHKTWDFLLLETRKSTQC